MTSLIDPFGKNTNQPVNTHYQFVPTNQEQSMF